MPRVGLEQRVREPLVVGPKTKLGLRPSNTNGFDPDRDLELVMFSINSDRLRGQIYIEMHSSCVGGDFEKINRLLTDVYCDLFDLEATHKTVPFMVAEWNIQSRMVDSNRLITIRGVVRPTTDQIASGYIERVDEQHQEMIRERYLQERAPDGPTLTPMRTFLTETVRGLFSGKDLFKPEHPNCDARWILHGIGNKDGVEVVYR